MPYVPHTDEDRRQMLRTLGLSSLDDLFRCVPKEIRLSRPLDVPPGRSEADIVRGLGELAARNSRMDDRPSFLGAGIYRRFIPAAVDAVASRGEFSTAYTPYQAEVSQGTLQAIMEYQTMIARLTAMDISNASLYDGATALAEAVLMAYAAQRRGDRVVISEGVHPEYRRVLETYLRNHPLRLASAPLRDGRTQAPDLEKALSEAPGEVVAIVVQNPNFFGFVEDLAATDGVLSKMGDARPFFICVADPVSLGILDPPGAHGADVVVGEGQQLGNPPSFGGPSFGFFATRMAHVRKVPGRIVGETRDRDGRRGYVLTFQTREQHIRRERATSNICTNQGLCCLRGAVYLALLGREGLREVAATSTRKAHHCFRRLVEIPGVETVAPAPFFQEFVLRLPLAADEVYRRLAAEGIGGGLPLGRYFPERSREMLFACTEMTTSGDIDRLADALAGILSRGGR